MLGLGLIWQVRATMDPRQQDSNRALRMFFVWLRDAPFYSAVVASIFMIRQMNLRTTSFLLATAGWKVGILDVINEISKQM